MVIPKTPKFLGYLSREKRFSTLTLVAKIVWAFESTDKISGIIP